jgi:hypothetical protein
VSDLSKLEEILNGLNPKQREACTCPERHVALVGPPGKGGSSFGISRGLTLTLAAQDNPLPMADVGYIGMWDQKKLFQTTITDFMALLTQKGFAYHKNLFLNFLVIPAIRLQLFWGHTDVPEEIVNQNLGWIFLEQAEKGTPWQSFLNLDSRLRYPGVFHSLFLTANAFPKGHWLTREFVEIGGKVIHTTLRDNTHLPADYYKRLDKLNAVDRKRLEEGELVTLGGLFYPMATRARHGSMALAPSQNIALPLTRAWDYGQQACLITQKVRNRLLCLKEFMGEFGEPLRSFKIRVAEWCQAEYGDRIYRDVQDKTGHNKDVTRSVSAYDIMISHPWRIAPRDPPHWEDRDYGHELIRELLTKEEEGLPLLLVDPVNCPLLLEGLVYGYVAKDRAEGLVPKAEPVDNIYKHLQDDLRAAADINFPLFRKAETQSRKMPRTIKDFEKLHAQKTLEQTVAL